MSALMGRHVSEDDLILFHYSELPEAADVARHIEGCARCAGALEEIRASLSLVDAADAAEVSDIPEDYGARLWERLAPRLAPAGGVTGTPHVPALRFPRPVFARRWAIAASLLVMLLAGFIAGRFSGTGTTVTPLPISGEGRERVLLLAAGDHLERSQMMLAEIVNLNGTTSGDARVDFTVGRDRAGELAASGRIYRLSAQMNGEIALESMLDELERILVDIANAPPDLSHDELAALQRRIERQGILLKIRAMGARVRERGLRMKPTPAPAGATT